MVRAGTRNPFDFGTASIPAVWAGRDALLERIDQSLDKGARVADRQTLMVGARGFGKTALINEWHRRAEHKRWATMSVTAEPGRLIDEVRARVRSLLERAPRRRRRKAGLRRAKDFHLSVGPLGGGVGLQDADLDVQTDSLANALDLLSLAYPRGVLLTVDEAQANDISEIAELGQAWQRAERGGRSERWLALRAAGRGTFPRGTSWRTR